ncbi:hypothetical protein [uncultured Treponema sp.]|uniref:hypothetical protein n=1 Tax=uncultured Treponema sp. TaxID=162155 RepID=UPI0025E7255E|nr:hypothetical protein [uncultured Treponema sp.]
MTDTILCIDIGTSSLKAALLPDNLSKAEIFVSRQPFPKSAFRESNSAQYYLSALKAALEELHQKNPDYAIEAVCVSGNGPTLISEDGKTLLYSDLFELPSLGRVAHQKKEALKNTKSLFIPRLAAFRELFYENWAKSAHIFGTPEFLLYKLTGNAVSILPEERFLPAYWNDEELESCGFSASEIKKLPPFVNSGAFVGKVSEKAALETGLLEGTLVFAGAPDFVVALIGTGTVFPGKLCDRAGTSEGLNLCTAKPVSAEGLRTMPSVVPGMWNLSYLLNSSQSSQRDFSELNHGISLLREAAVANGEAFPDCMTITGGQALSDEVIAQKEAATGLKIKKMPCTDAELIGDLILARVALGDYDDIVEAVFAILGV